MAVLFMMCGLPGSGKTTIAKGIERERPALRLDPDEWMARIVGDGYDAERREAIKAIQMEIAMRTLELGVDVVSEAGFWSRQERDACREKAAAIGATVRLIFLDVPEEELRRRLAKRNAALPANTFRVEPEQLKEMTEWFEAPTADERPERLDLQKTAP